MDGNVRNRRCLFHFERFVSIAVATSYLLSALPGCAFCGVQAIERLDQEFTEEIQKELLLKFNEIKQILHSSENRNLEAIKSIQELLDEVNYQYKMSLTLSDLCCITRDNIGRINVDNDLQPLLLEVISNFETTEIALKSGSQNISPLAMQCLKANLEIFGYGLYAPWKWSWFGLNKKKNKELLRQYVSFANQITYPGPMPKDDGSIPDDLIICGIEALVAGLFFLIPSGGYTQAIAIAICYDMGSRGAEGLKQLSEMNKSRQNSLNGEQNPFRKEP